MVTVKLGARAPEFSLTGTDGKTYSLSEALGQGPVLLVFFKTTCGTCDLAFPYLNRLKETYPENGWSLWSVAQDPASEAEKYAAAHVIKHPVLPDGHGYPVSKAYDPPATPTLFLIDGTGEVVQESAGFSKEELNDISAALAQRLGEAAVAVAEAEDGNPDFKPG